MTKLRPVPKQALPGARLNAFAMEPGSLVIVGLDTKDGPEHPLWDERIRLDLPESFVRNVSTYGVIEPVVVVKDGDHAIVVDGRQRVRAAREANLRRVKEGAETIRVPCVVRRGESRSMVGVSISANAQRRDNQTLANARGALRFSHLGRGDEDVALAYGVSVQTVHNWLELASLHPDVQAMVEAGTVGATKAVLACKGKPQSEHVQAVAGASTAKRGRPPGPTKTTLRKLALDTKTTRKLHPEFVRALRFVLGELSAKDVGLDGVVP